MHNGMKSASMSHMRDVPDSTVHVNCEVVAEILIVEANNTRCEILLQFPVQWHLTCRVDSRLIKEMNPLSLL